MKTFGQYIAETTANSSDLITENINDGSLPVIRQLINHIENIRRQAQTSHWNIRGSDFLTLHKAFDEVYEFAQESIDKLAERCKSIDSQSIVRIDSIFQPVGTPDKVMNISLMVDILQTEQIQLSLSKLDPVTENIVQEMIAEFDKHRWFIESSR